MSNDYPKYWNEEEIDPETGEIISPSAELVPVKEEIPLPTIEEQKTIVSSVIDLNPKDRGLLNSLVEMNNVAQTLLALRTQETAEQRRTVIQAWCENFINARMQNNVTAETLKQRLLIRLINNIDNLDLQTVSQIYNDLSETSSVDAQQAMASINGGTGIVGGSSGINLTINNATSEGASITNNTLNASPQNASTTKEVSILNNSIKAWGKVPLPNRK